MALNIDLAAGDVLVVPEGSSARIEVLAKSGRRTRLAVESDTRIVVHRAHTPQHPAQQRLTTRGTSHG